MSEITVIDLSHTVEEGMVTYRGLPAPAISDHLSYEESRGHYAEGTTFHSGKIEMVANTGTYIDAPLVRCRRTYWRHRRPLGSLPGVRTGPSAGFRSGFSHSLLRNKAGRQAGSFAAGAPPFATCLRRDPSFHSG